MESLGRFAGGIAHDFNNILTAIAGNCENLREEMRRDDPAISYVDQIAQATQKAINLTSSILTFSRKKPISPTPISISSTIRNLENLLTRIIGRGIKLKTALDGEDILVNADEGQIELVLMNLAANARDAMPDGGRLRIAAQRVPSEKVPVTVGLPMKRGSGEDPQSAACSAKPGGDFIEISVSDTGAGMDDETIERIFEPFFTTKDVGKGTGLGLAIVYSIVKQHGGYIDVWSRKGEGATFRIFLPLA